MGLRRNRLVALIAACALVACAAVYSAHAIADGTHPHSHCDLCVHFSGSAGAQAHAKAVGKPPLVVRAAPTPTPLFLPTRPALGLPLPRGPPASLTV